MAVLDKEIQTGRGVGNGCWDALGNGEPLTRGAQNSRVFLALGTKRWYGCSPQACRRKKAILQEKEDLFKQELMNHRMVCVGRDLWKSSSPTALPRAGTSSTRAGCSKPCPTWPWTLPPMEHLQLLWTTCAKASPPPPSE